MADRPAVKICGLMRREDAEAADALGVDYVGVVLTAGFRRTVAPEAGRALVAGLQATPVVVLVDESAEGAGEKADFVGAGVVQLHGSEKPDVVSALRLLGPWRIWKAVRAAHSDDVKRAVDAYGAIVDGFVVEGVRPGVVGGGGARLDPAAMGDLRALIPSDRLLVLAGGLTPDTVAAAVDRFRPSVVDVSSGVEATLGRKGPDLMEVFVRRARQGGPAPHRSPQPHGDPQ